MPTRLLQHVISVSFHLIQSDVDKFHRLLSPQYKIYVSPFMSPLSKIPKRSLHPTASQRYQLISSCRFATLGQPRKDIAWQSRGLKEKQGNNNQPAAKINKAAIPFAIRGSN